MPAYFRCTVFGLIVLNVLPWSAFSKPVHPDDTKRPYLNATCAPGTFYRKEKYNYACIECPNQHYCPHHKHQSPECLKCSKLTLQRKWHDHLVIDQPCTATHDTIFKCASGYCRCPSNDNHQEFPHCSTECQCEATAVTPRGATDAGSNIVATTTSPSSVVSHVTATENRTTINEEVDNPTTKAVDKNRARGGSGYVTELAVLIIPVGLLVYVL